MSRSILHRPLLTWRLSPCLYCLLACSLALSQTKQNQTDKQHSKLITGCVTSDIDGFHIASVDGGLLYVVTGHTSGLADLVGKEISAEGTANPSTKPWPSFHVRSVKQIFDAPQPHLNPSFNDHSLWHSEVNEKYGIKFAHPESLVESSVSSMLTASFVAYQSLVIVTRLQIPREIYPQTNFVGGEFGIFVNPDIKNVESCSEFDRSDTQDRSFYVSRGVRYSRVADRGGAGGTSYSNQHLHTFRNGLCYEIAFNFAEYDKSLSDLGCTVPNVGDAEELKLIESLLAGISFVRPTLAIAKSADLATNLSQLTFSWSTENADYVEFT